MVACKDFTGGFGREYDMNEFQNMALGEADDSKRDSFRSISSERSHGVEIQELKIISEATKEIYCRLLDERIQNIYEPALNKIQHEK